MCCACDPNEHLSALFICFVCVFWMSEVISSFRSLRAGSQVFALLMLFLCVILHTMSSGKSLQLICILPFGMVCAFTSPVRTECGMFVMYCMQCCISVSAVL